MTAVSPLAPADFAELPPIAGVRLGTAQAGIKQAGRTDLMAMVFDRPATVAGVFTTSRCPSAPVEWCRERLANGAGLAQAVVVNAGNANAFTGVRGTQATGMTAKAAAQAFGVAEDTVFLASTGVIGEPLDASGFEGHLLTIAKTASEDGWYDAARAIMTTDTYPKLATRSVQLGVDTITINGIAKGSGMIAPDMATMLAFLVTDAAIAPDLLQAELAAAVKPTFNAITVDSDTSTSDTVLAFATGSLGMAPSGSGSGTVMALIENPADARLAAFREGLHAVLHDLAMQTIRDGEGATKQVEITVTGADSDESAGRIARSIANSPLVKTAIAGEDANWGRIVMAIGKAGEPADRDRIAIRFGDVEVARDGERVPGYSEAAAAAVMKRPEIVIGVDLGLAQGRATVWTCDLTKAYVAINGDYRS
ncbi:bifunctional glutamate N-acetyltransferase/amino-acid acetyltransferase ArgJ [Rhizobiaceae bacterium]|nr:bifunctional glutamate N-acetyltransferase/amino-acid acetyltransferase ArgJ [Rhizobiaceae bacterium]